MKRLTTTTFFLCLAVIAFAQNTIEIDLADWSGKTEKTAFSINSVEDNRENSNEIGFVNISKNKEKEIVFGSNSSEMIQQFILKNFDPGHEMSIRMEIEQLDIQEMKLKKNKTLSVFLFACKFYKMDDSQQEALYSFNAKNSILKKNNLKTAMTNYTGRAIQAAILNFKKSYKKHPEWKKAQAASTGVEIKKEIIFNKFMGGDTIALDGNYQLKAEDFAGIVGDEEEYEAYSYFIMTYTLDAVDEDNTIALKITPKTFFLRSQSWAKKTEENNWLAYQQLLFDLAAHHSNLFKKKLETKELSAGFYKTEINQIYNKTTADYFDEMDNMQAQTKYGEDPEKVASWRAKVDTYLEKK